MSQCPFKTLLDFDTFAQGTPHELIGEMRSAQRILWQPDNHATGGHWLLFQMADIDYVLRTSDLFTSNFGPIIDDVPPDLLDSMRGRSITFMDPPEHRKYRALVEYAFRPGLLKEREPIMREMGRAIIDRVIDRGECEFVSEVAIQLPMRVMYYLLGVRPEDEQRVAALTNAMILADDPEMVPDRAAGFQAAHQLNEYGAALAADHRANPRDNITMEVLNAESEGQRMSDSQFGYFFTTLIGGGLDTTRNTLSWAMVEFIRNPEQYKKLQADPALVPGAVEEILRFRNPVAYVRRTATRDLELCGEKIPKGGKVICVIAAPNRDPARFDRPDEFDITRAPAETRVGYRTFGGGPHFCLGLHQARMNLTVMLDEISRRFDNLRLIGEPRHTRSIFMDGFNALHLGFDKRVA